MNGKAEELRPKRFLDMFGIGLIEVVLFLQPPMRPFGGRVLATDLVQFGEHDVAQMA